MKDGRRVVSSDVVDLKYRNGVASLTIEEAFPEDEGTYECIASNSEGRVSSRAKIGIILMDARSAAAVAKKTGAGAKPPRITSHFESVSVSDGSSLSLRCTIKCDTPYDVIWLHNDKEIKARPDAKIRAAGDSHTLDIAEVFPEDAGVYTCEAFNDAGVAFTTATVLVKGRPALLNQLP